MMTLQSSPRPWGVALLSCALLASDAVPEPGVGPAELEPWPAEGEGDAINWTGVEGGFEKDLSGAVWNPETSTLWLCRNAPRGKSKLWGLARNEAGPSKSSAAAHNGPSGGTSGTARG